MPKSFFFFFLHLRCLCARSPFMLACANAWCNTSDARAKHCQTLPLPFSKHMTWLPHISVVANRRNRAFIPDWMRQTSPRPPLLAENRTLTCASERRASPSTSTASNLLLFHRSWCLAVATHLPRNPPVDWLRPLIPLPWRWTCERHQKRKMTCVKTCSNLHLNRVPAALDSQTGAPGLSDRWRLHTEETCLLLAVNSLWVNLCNNRSNTHESSFAECVLHSWWPKRCWPDRRTQSRRKKREMHLKERVSFK